MSSKKMINRGLTFHGVDEHRRQVHGELKKSNGEWAFPFLRSRAPGPAFVQHGHQIQAGHLKQQ